MIARMSEKSVGIFATLSPSGVLDWMIVNSNPRDSVRLLAILLTRVATYIPE